MFDDGDNEDEDGPPVLETVGIVVGTKLGGSDGIIDDDVTDGL